MALAARKYQNYSFELLEGQNRIVRRAGLRQVRSRMIVQPEKAERPKLSQFIAPAILFVALGFQVWVRISIVQQGYHVAELRESMLSHDRYLRQLKLDHAYVTGPTFLAEKAKEKLNLQPMRPQQVRTLSISKKVS